MNAKRLHIFIASRIEPDAGGCETWLAYFLPKMIRRFNQVSVYYVGGGSRIVDVPGVVYIPLRCAGAGAFMIKALAAALRIANAGDIFLAIGSYEAAWPLLVLRRLRAIRIVVWIREKHIVKKASRRPVLHLLFSWMERRVLNAAELVVFNGYDTKAFYDEVFRDCRARPSVVIPNAVDLRRFQNVKLDPPCGVLRLCYMGRFVPEKGFGFMLAFHDQIKNDDRFLLRFYGYGDESVEKELGERGINWTHYGPGDLEDIFSACDGVVFANVEQRDSSAAGVSHSLLEAMAAGRLVVAARNTIHTQVLDDGCAVLYEEGKVNDLVLRLQSLDSAGMAALMRAAREKAHAYSIDAHVRAFMDAIL